MANFRKWEERDLPSEDKAWEALQDLHRVVMFKDPTSDIAAMLAPKAPSDQPEFFRKNRIVLRPIDMQTRLPNGTPCYIKSEQIEGLISLATVGHLRAYRKSTPTVWTPKEAMTRIRQETPSIFYKDEGALFYISLSMTPSLILERNLPAFAYTSWRDGSEGIGILRETGHSTPDCSCGATYEGNNFFGMFFGLCCVPAEHARNYMEQSQEWDTLKEHKSVLIKFINYINC
jgi:hypothetical protein